MPSKERIRFPGDPVPRETGSGQAPATPLNQHVAQTTVEMLDQTEEPAEEEIKSWDQARGVDKRPVPRRAVEKKLAKAQEEAAKVEEVEQDDFEDDGIDEEGPEYARESIGARIGQSMEETKGVQDVIETLESDDVVPLLFPKKVSLQDKGLMHHWGPGVHLVPVSLAGETPKAMHWWLKDNRVRRAGKRMPNPAREDA
jgi:hypothetical protein